jgi:hypothetical protein
MLRDAGVVAWHGEAIDQDLVAARAGTVLPVPAPGPAAAAVASPDAAPAVPAVPPGAEPWADYRFEFPLAEPAASGTSPAGLVAAIEELSGGELTAVPLRAAPWSAGTVINVVERGVELGARLLANIRSGLLWGSRPAAAVLTAELEGVEPPEAPPPADWDVGHFVELVGLLRGRAGALVLVRDSYPTLGWDGQYLQPPRVLAAALERGDGREGGVLMIVPGDRHAEAVRLAGELALEVQMWDNGRRR